MKKLINLFSAALLFTPSLASAQRALDIGEEITKQGNNFIKAFGVIAVVGLIGVFVWQWDNLLGKNGDSKKAIVTIVVYLVIVGLVAIGAAYLRGVSL